MADLIKDRHGIETVSLTVFGQPRTKSNIRSSVWSKKSKRQIVYKDPEVEAYELGIQGQIRSEIRDMGLPNTALPLFGDGIDVRARFAFYFPRRPTRSDVQNYFKSVCDAMNGIVWLDDSQVIEIHGSKHHDKERPRIEIEVRRAK